MNEPTYTCPEIDTYLGQLTKLIDYTREEFKEIIAAAEKGIQWLNRLEEDVHKALETIRTNNEELREWGNYHKNQAEESQTLLDSVDTLQNQI